MCSADGSTHTESNKLYRKVKHRYRPNLTPRQRPTAKARHDQAALAVSAEARGATHRARALGVLKRDRRKSLSRSFLTWSTWTTNPFSYPLLGLRVRVRVNPLTRRRCTPPPPRSAAITILYRGYPYPVPLLASRCLELPARFQPLTHCFEQSLPHIYPDILGDGFQYHLSQLTFSDQWYGPQTCHERTWVRLPVLSHFHRRWLQDTSKRKLAYFFDFFRAPPFPFPRVYPRMTRRLMKTSAPDLKIGLIETFSRVYPKKGKHAPGK